jgi:hypothetical protein
MIGLVIVWFISVTLFYAMVNSTGEAQSDGHSMSYDVGYLVGSKDAKVSGVLPTEDTEALGIASYQMAKKSMTLDIVEFCTGYVAGYAAYLNGIV